MSIGNFLDKTPEYAAKAIAYEAYRHIYGRLGDSEFKDPYVATYKDKRLTGSIYPDVDNQEFFKVMKQVADLASTLPRDLQIPYRVIDEIRYTPHSKYFEKSGVLDGGVAYYDRRWSHPGRRIIFLRRNLRFSSPVDTLLSVIHEGVHVVQDIRSESFEDRILEKRIRLENLEKAKKGKGPEAGTIRMELARMDDYVKRWRRGVLKEGRLVQDIRFECEATMTEIEVTKAVGAPPEMVERSQYLSLCDDARIAIARWKDCFARKTAEAAPGDSRRQRLRVSLTFNPRQSMAPRIGLCGALFSFIFAARGFVMTAVAKERNDPGGPRHGRGRTHHSDKGRRD